MMTINKILSITFALILCGNAQAQKIKVETPVVDLGQVQFYNPTRATFELKNVGKKPLLIDKVDTSCGCAEAEFPQSPVEAGESFAISVLYDARMMGHFHKIIDVYSNASAEPVSMDLRGVVVETVEEYVGDFPFQLGALTTDCNTISFKDIHLGETLQQRFHIYNPTSQAVKPQVMHLPAYLTAEISPTSVAPNHSAEVTITLDSRFMHDYGYKETLIYVGANPGERVSSDKKIEVGVTLLPAVKELTPELQALAPGISLSATEVVLPIADRKKKTAVIDIQNTGKTALEILNLQILSEGINVSLNKTTLEAGETAKMKIATDPKRLKNLKTQPRLLMITNAPNNPKVVIDVITNPTNEN